MTDIKVNTALADLKSFLTKLFQFESADLDFGIYKILQYKKTEVENFINTLLVEEVHNQLNLFVAKDKEVLENEYKQLSANSIIDGWRKAVANSHDPEYAQKVIFYENEFKEELDRYQYLRTLFTHQQSIEDAEPLIYNHLTIFFSRYYDKGDFISKRRYGKSEKYVVPYNGEETYFHWANADQYYIKSSELFRKYSFRVTAPDGHCNIHFKLREAKEETGNTKSENNKFFVISENPVEESENEVTIFFEHRALANTEKENKGKNQDELNAYAMPIITKALSKHTVLAELNKAVNDKTKLALELHRYTARNKYDFFIHKDLKGFLTRELDFYIKSELLKLDDLTVFDSETHYEKIKLQFNIVKTFKSIASTIIDFISQVEDFQKKLWEKKKFVISTEYVITFDKLAAFTSSEFTESIINEVIDNEAQVKEWKELFGEAIFHDWKNLTLEQLKNGLFEFKKLPIDTVHFSNEFKWKLLCKISEKKKLDDVSDGLVINADNFQALNLLLEKYLESIGSIYTDPPYNAKSSEIIYKNTFKHSSWMSLINNTLPIARLLLNDNGLIQMAIDDYEYKNLHHLFDVHFSSENFIANVVVVHNPRGRNDDKFYGTAHEYMLCYAKERETATFNNFSYSEADLKQYNKEDSISKYAETSFMRTGNNSDRNTRPNLFYSIFYNPIMDNLSLIKDSNDFIELLPINSSGEEKTWRWGKETFIELKETELFVKKVFDEFRLFKKRRMKPEGKKPKTIWHDPRYDASSNGIMVLKDLFGRQVPFSYPKALGTVIDALSISTKKDDIVIDYFPGSGTTFHALQILNSIDNGKRKCILTEQGEYTITVIIPRIKKIAYSFDWNEGKPQNENGLGIFFKYQRLEQYEESLENIAFTSANDTAQTQLQFKDYIPKYFLHFETATSKPFMNLDAFQNPFNYTLKVFDNYKYTEQTVDVVETFNYLIGLHLHGYSKLEHQKRDYLFVTGSDRQNRRIAIVWRDATDLDFEKDRDFIRQTINGSSYDVLYANNQCAIEGAVMIEEVFSHRMSQSI